MVFLFFIQMRRIIPGDILVINSWGFGLQEMNNQLRRPLQGGEGYICYPLGIQGAGHRLGINIHR